ncbi:MAG: GNAT family N-acetyltransferase, partial [Gammaproteobacteria bacterium]
MSKPDFRVIEADYTRDLPRLRAVREPVFVMEQQVPLDLEWDTIDPDCRHVLALDAEDRPVGTGRLTPQHSIGRMAVLPDWRGKGVGDALLIQLIALARDAGWPSVSLHAQV